MTLYCDPSVQFGGVAVGGIRISHLSDINRTMEIALTTTRGKRKPYSVKPIKEELVKENFYPQDKFELNFEKMVNAVVTGKMTFKKVFESCKKTGLLTEDQVNKLKEAIEQAKNSSPPVAEDVPRETALEKADQPAVIHDEGEPL